MTCLYSTGGKPRLTLNSTKILPVLGYLDWSLSFSLSHSRQREPGESPQGERGGKAFPSTVHTHTHPKASLSPFLLLPPQSTPEKEEKKEERRPKKGSKRGGEEREEGSKRPGE